MKVTLFRSYWFVWFVVIKNFYMFILRVLDKTLWICEDQCKEYNLENSHKSVWDD
jgi:hypothetical protein